MCEIGRLKCSCPRRIIEEGISHGVVKVMIDQREKRDQFHYIGLAVDSCIFTGAIPLLSSAGAFACCVSTLCRYAPL